MAARPIPPPQPDPTQKKKAVSETVLPVEENSNAVTLQKYIHTMGEKRWLRIVVIAVAVFFLLLKKRALQNRTLGIREAR